MVMNDSILVAAAQRFGTPCYVYFWDRIAERVIATREAFGGRFEISFAVKSNPNRAILSRLKQVVDHFDVSSGGELLLVEEAGGEPEKVSFVGPGKTRWELELALDRGCGHLVVESEAEIKLLDRLAGERGVSAPIVLRINPKDLPKGFGISMSRRASPFGIDEDVIDSAVALAIDLDHIELCGFHIYSGSQCLSADSIAENFENCGRIFRELSARHDLQPQVLIFGSGFGIPYHDGDTAIDLSLIAEKMEDELGRLGESSYCGKARLILELGRFLVAEAGVYLARVQYKKSSRDTQILILDGGMNHHLGASGNLGSVIRRNYPIRSVHAVEPTPEVPAMKYDLSGPMCTSIDSLGRNVELGRVEAGDLIAIGSSGAYGPTASPVGFITHRPAAEVLVERVSPPGASALDELLDITGDGPLASPPNFPRSDASC